MTDSIPPPHYTAFRMAMLVAVAAGLTALALSLADPVAYVPLLRFLNLS